MEFLKQYNLLYKKSRTDLKVAKNLLRDFEDGDDELDLEVIMFHLQQCAEKSLKSLLSFNSLHFTRTHDLEVLIDALDGKLDHINNKEDLILLNEFAVEGRYGIIHDDIYKTHEYIKILDELTGFVKNKIS